MNKYCIVEFVFNFTSLNMEDDLFGSSDLQLHRPPAKWFTYPLLGFFHMVGLKERVLRELAFFPPNPPGYALENDKVHITFWSPCLRKRRGCEHIPEKYNQSRLEIGLMEPGHINISLIWLTNGSRTSKPLPAMHIRHKKESKSRPLIIWAHGNATDLGIMLPSFIAVAESCQVDVLGFEYSGYGLAGGQPSERECFANIRQAYLYAVKKLNVPHKRIAILGQSVGSAAAVDLASDPAYPIGWLILQSGLASGMRLFYNDINKPLFFDCFTNVQKIAKCKSIPILLLHGKADTEVPCRHSYELYLEASGAEGVTPSTGGCCSTSTVHNGVKTRRVRDEKQIYWRISPSIKQRGGVYQFSTQDERVTLMIVEIAGHNDLEDCMGDSYFNVIKEFIK